MKPLIVVAALAAILISCSKSGSSSETSDSTAVDSTVVATTDSPIGKGINITAKELETLSWETFLHFHEQFAEGINSGATVYREEFATNGRKISYQLQLYIPDELEWPNKGIDSISYDGGYIVNNEEYQRPPNAIKWVYVSYPDGMMYENDWSETPYGGYQNYPSTRTIPNKLFDIDKTEIIPLNQFYLWAKIANITDDQLDGLSKDDLTYLRNEIFARHGHTFKTPKMKDYFEKKNWYHAIINDAAPLLNVFEKRNVEFIKKKEDQL